MKRGALDGEAVVLDVPQLQAMLRTFNVGIDVDRRKPLALNRLELSKALQGAVEANAVAAKAIAIERGVGTEEIVGSEALALHAAAFNGIPDPVFHLVERAIGIIAALAQIEPDPRAGENDMLLDTATRAATALAQLLQARHGFTTANTPAERDRVTAALTSAGEELHNAAGEIDGFLHARRTQLGRRSPRPQRSELAAPQTGL
jgi:hypothetical protein